MYGNNKISVIRYVKRLPKTNWNPCFEGWKEERVRSAIKHGDLAHTVMERDTRGTYVNPPRRGAVWEPNNYRHLWKCCLNMQIPSPIPFFTAT